MAPRLPKVRLKAIPVFPSNVTGGNAIDVTKANGSYSIDLNVSDIQIAAVPDADTATIYAVSWGSVTTDNPGGTFQLVPYAGLQGASSDLSSLADLGTFGIVSRTADATYATRTITAGTGIGVTNGGGVAGNPAVAITDAELLALAGLTSAADQVPYFTGSGTAALASFPTYGRSLAGSANAAAAITTLGLTSPATTTPAALTRTSDTNVTLTLGGTPNTALLQATSITVGWSGTLAASRGGFGADVSASSGVPLFAAGVPTFTSTTGAGNFVRATSPALVTPNLGTPAAAVLTSATGLPISTGLTGAGTGILAALAVNVGTAGSAIVNGGVLGTPSSGTLTNCTIPVTNLTGSGTNVNAFLATPSSANLRAALTDETGTGAAVFATSPALLTPTGIVNSDVGLARLNAAARAGSFDTWQRLVNAGTTIAVPASTTAYANDGWYLATGATQASHVNQVAGIATGSTKSAQVIRDSGQTGATVMRYAMPFDADEIAMLAGSNATLSFTIKEGANQSFSHSVTATVYCGTGAVAKRNASAYTSETSAISLPVTTTTTATRVQATSAAVIPVGTTQMEIQFSWTPSGTAGADDSFTVDDLQLEPVATATSAASPFIKRSFQEQLALCQRFLAAFNSSSAGSANFAFGGALSSTTMFVVIPFHVPMRIKPTGITISAASDFNATSGNGTGIALSALTFLTASVDSTSLFGTVAAGLTLGQHSVLQQNAFAAQIVVTGAEI